mmetsp:Transcript_14815/g.40957  ORF Transcript_14815/g.40957 Transcript_14815/m.40957 type:complete len:356 (-) Transcript_14815:180-1247(-)|eukprot:CAMPEP_0179099096 /NCGR_PEP_ID=MMETSP0796-20121207/45701_1 /TAXON_ID=73915 /ORGANISM="Pyrodinium bahamense, Strain pbaha01" /LENGTH=355 /DNA_ID=CAMNT_0020796891 /DNA_START=73 /DNA_END=1140 /DNA_ORIENTATION=+
MGKSIRSKIKKRLRTAKRQRVDAMIITPREKEHHEALRRVIEGRAVTLSRPKNAFKYPGDATSVFPQHEIMKPIDFRSQNLPMATYAFRGNRRKYEGEQAEYMKNLAKTSHPQMEVLAGGGAILSQSGRRISMKEAEILATVANNPDSAAAVVGAPSSGSDAVATAIAEAALVSAGHGAGSDVEMAQVTAPALVAAADAAAGPASVAALPVADEEEEVLHEADHSRVPILKDSRRAKRTAEHRPRSNAVKKKTKVRVQTAAPVADSAPRVPTAAPIAPAETAVDAAPALRPAGKGKKKKKGGKGGAEGADGAEAAAGPPRVEPENAPAERIVSKGKKNKKKAAESAEAADVDMAP